MKTLSILLILIFYSNLVVGTENKECTAVAREEVLLVVSTLAGGLIALDPITSEKRWAIEDEPSVKTPNSNDFSSVYLPDPRSGSLYKLGTGGVEGNELKKLPYTIPELVKIAPCKSSDGILYSGKKSDSWFMIDPKTGQREHVFGFGAQQKAKQSSDSIGFATSRAVYLGRTQYTVLMYDSKSADAKPYNITFFDYNSHTMAQEVSDKYDFIHVTSSTRGEIATIQKNGNFLWKKTDLSSPIVAIFLLSKDGFLSVPFTTVGDEVLEKIVDYSVSDSKSDFQLYPTVFIGESKGGASDTLYAINSFVHKDTPTIKKNSINLFLEGPNGREQNLPSETNKQTIKNNFILYGHYEVPPVDVESIGVKTDKFNSELTIKTDLNRWHNFINFNRDLKIIPETGAIIEAVDSTINSDKKNKSSFDKEEQSEQELKNGVLKTTQLLFKNWFDHEENKVLKLLMLITIGCVISLFWYFHATVRELRQGSQNSSKTLSTNSTDLSTSYEVRKLIDDEMIEVGKIRFNPREVLGKGCEGTFVFKGTFEERQVAVKRLLPGCFTLADREVALLRESDTHENVVRYFCTESDRQFRYIALELCQATLQEFTESAKGSHLRKIIDLKDVLYQATKGLSHLHNLSIVHRDIKPQNVLISHPDSKQQVRIMISDFGLCKKLICGKASFSRRSGVTGTEGWIAPEMLRGQRTTTSVDIFSLGCVYYYVLSSGGHPFGCAIKRQANILGNESDLSKLDNKKHQNVLAVELIHDMINKDSTKRPSAESVLTHPFFWKEDRILSFLQDVSDRIEKVDIQYDPLKTLERNAKYVVNGDWSMHLDEEITVDLRKYRGYHGISVRDLLRALRNKKHHYHELSYDVQQTLGSIPFGFTRYWTDRFPSLVSHSYHAMETCSSEYLFKAYYSPCYTFTKPEYLLNEDYDNINLQMIYDSAKNTFGRSPKKDAGSNYKNDKLQSNHGKVLKNKGAYNFKNPAANQRNFNTFITRDDMQKPDGDQKVRTEDKLIWTLNE